jgi:hypothetical protein
VIVLALSLGACRFIAVGRDVDTLKSLHTLDSRRVGIVPLSFYIDDDSKKIAILAANVDYAKNKGAHLFIDAIGVATISDPMLV